MSEVVARFVDRTGIPRVPETDWRLQASTIVGWFLLEELLTRPPYDWLVQSISAAFGPIGVYGVLLEHRSCLGPAPRFLGVQQAANCPMVHAWRATRPQPGEDDPLLLEVMYDRDSPRFGTFGALKRILESTNGDLSAITRDQYRSRMRAMGGTMLEGFAANAAPIALREGSIIEKAGVVALVGALGAIDAGSIAPGSRVLVCLTGGTGAAGTPAFPQLRVRPGMTLPDDLGARCDATVAGAWR